MKISPVLTAAPTYGWLTLRFRLMLLTIIPQCMTPMADSNTTRISIQCPRASAAVLLAPLHLTASNSSPQHMDRNIYTGLVPLHLNGLVVARRDSLMPCASPVSNAFHRRWNNHLFPPYACQMSSFPTDYIHHPCRPSTARTIHLLCLLFPAVLLIGSARGTSHSKKPLTPKVRETCIAPLTRLTLLSAAQLVQFHPYSRPYLRRLVVVDATTSAFQSPSPT